MRRGAIAIFMIMFAMLAGWAVATPVTVGPLDGKPGPSLQPIATPGSIVTEKIPGTAFPAALEQAGDFPSALLEWQRVAYQATGEDRLNALNHVADIQGRLGYATAAIHTYTTLLNEFPQQADAPFIHYQLAHLTTSAAHQKEMATISSTYAATPWGQAVLMQHVWQQALTGDVSQTYGLPRAVTLKQRLSALKVTQANAAAMAGTLGVVPGAGHAYLGLWAQGLVLFVAWALFTLAFLSACRHRHYAYAFVFVIPAAALWLGSSGSAIQLARRQAVAQRLHSLAQWKDLAPVIPALPRYHIPGTGEEISPTAVVSPTLVTPTTPVSPSV